MDILWNCQQVKLNRMVQNIPIPPQAFKEQNITITKLRNWTKQTCLTYIALNAAVDNSGSLAQLLVKLMLQLNANKIHSPVLKLTAPHK